ncbi:MAG TPA: GNAT family N-acetyltransferase [Pirellulales bacterium]|nr:GNAT family N-acetyltransferase [Pirellulales bacterium]
MARVVEINCLERLRGYRGNWNWLLADTRGATFFQTFDWLEIYLRHFGGRLRLRVLLVSGSDGPLGILPLVVLPEATRLGTVRVLTYPMDGWGTFYGPIGPQPTATLLAGLRHVAATRRDWDLVDLRWVDADGVDKGRTRQALRAAALAASEQPLLQAAQIETSGGWKNYWSERDPDWRREVERSRRKLADLGELQFVRYRPAGASAGEGDPRWELYDACEAIARRSWQGSSSDGTTLSHESVRGYLRDAHASAVSAGGVDLNLLRIGGRPAAFAYNYHYAGSVYGLRAGFDPAIGRSGAGSVLMRMLVEDSFCRGDELIDLGPDPLKYKRRWSTRVQTAYHYPHYAAAGLKAQALRAKRWLLGAKV